MAKSVQAILERQREVLEAMAQIRTMERGTLSLQVYPTRAERKQGQGAVGPYGLWQGTVGGKRFGRRVSGKQVERIEHGIAQRHAFEALCEEYVALSCELSVLESQGDEQRQDVKKKSASPSNRLSK